MGAGASRRANKGVLRSRPQRAQERGGGPSWGPRGSHSLGCFPRTSYRLHCWPFLLLIRHETAATDAHPSYHWASLSLARQLSAARQLPRLLMPGNWTMLVYIRLTQSSAQISCGWSVWGLSAADEGKAFFFLFISEAGCSGKFKPETRLPSLAGASCRLNTAAAHTPLPGKEG